MTHFPATQWLLVEMAGQSSPTIARAAMNQLLERYWQPMFVHLRYKGLTPEEAEDLLQDFIIEILDKNLLAIADRKKGKFRTLLLTALDRFAISKHRYNTAAKRAPKDMRSLDAGDGEDVAGDAATGQSLVFERAWALDVLAETLAAMQEECETLGESTRWTIFDRRVLAPLFEDAEPPEYAALAEELGLGGEKAAMNLLVTAKRQFARILRELVREYVVQSNASKAPSTGVKSAANDEAAASAARQMAEHAVVQAVEREIAELQQILASSRSAQITKRSEEAIRPAQNTRKAVFWQRLTQGRSLDVPRMDSMLDWGSVLTEGDFDAWVTDLLHTSVTALLGAEYPFAGSVRMALLKSPIPITVLEHLKEWANVQRFTLSASPQGKLADILYFLCIATALARTGTKITGMHDSAIRTAFAGMQASSWLDAELGAIIVKAAGQLAGAEP